MTSGHDEALWSAIKTNRQLSASRQIDAAIDHLNAGQFECAVTLALAAEDQIPESGSMDLFKALKQQGLHKRDINQLNFLRNWLKHPKEPEEIEFSEFEVAIALVRATSRFFGQYGTKTEKVEAFLVWCVSKNLFVEPEGCRSGF
jgi:hypothetical protein